MSTPTLDMSARVVLLVGTREEHADRDVTRLQVTYVDEPHEGTTSVELNDGSRWTVPVDTDAAIAKAAARIRAAYDTGLATPRAAMMWRPPQVDWIAAGITILTLAALWALAVAAVNELWLHV